MFFNLFFSLWECKFHKWRNLLPDFLFFITSGRHSASHNKAPPPTEFSVFHYFPHPLSLMHQQNKLLLSPKYIPIHPFFFISTTKTKSKLPPFLSGTIDSRFLPLFSVIHSLHGSQSSQFLKFKSDYVTHPLLKCSKLFLCHTK